MKKILLGVLTLCLTSAGGAQAQTKTVRLFLAPHSTVAPPDIMKNMASKCPNTTITIDPEKSDFMLQAWGWSGNYKFTVFQRGGTAVYGTATVTLSNAVKDICRFLESSQAQVGLATFPGSPSNKPGQDISATPDSLKVVRNALTTARDNLQQAANRSDYVQDAISDINQALDDTEGAITHISEDTGAPVPIARPNYVFDAAPPPPTPRANFMLYASIDSLSRAYYALARLSGGDFGGYRQRMNEDIGAAALVLVNGIASFNANHQN